ncbi:hypothetical protein BZA05DRAFT_378393 [Tricharina praecox]|uniref:uncharacterized protein n=1 Tax=Tricharina praecox TaxID=43433 RepID=UPI00221FDE0C|nr:uncharacterized protein BZA05DRAFT_378393 [Tricharina praecox]KAI5844911.1 hypothetical protein BZA05DRAFT_378393 [Tricharina praecox]
MILSLLTTTLLLLARPGASSPSPSHCKTYPGDAGWPSLADWRTLNRTVGGNLFAYVPLGSVCSSTSSQYDAAGCASVRSKWVTQALVQADPGLVRATTYTNNTCNPPAVAVGAPCTQGYYPEYVLQAKNRRDIAAVVRFAKKRNLRLNIKNTGHDFIGRSIARGSLSIWLHEWKGSEFFSDFKTSCPGSKAQYAGKITGGNQWKDTYSEALAAGRLVVGGASASVGSVGGYIQGGGHSPWGAHYGMAADQVLEFEAVGLDGKIITINECTNPDLFWALRGGGGGTFAVVTSVTIKTYPIPEKIVVGSLLLSTTDLSGVADTWWSGIGAVNEALGQLSEAGVMGYYYTTPSIKSFSFTIYHFDVTPEQTRAAFAPLMAKLQAISASANSTGLLTSTLTVSATSYASLVAGYAADNGTAVVSTGGGFLMSSRLLPASAMSDDPAAFLAAFRTAANGATQLLGHLVAGGKVARNANLSVALNAAWRNAISHMIVLETTSSGAEPAAVEAQRLALAKRTSGLRKLSPGSGAYINECDLHEENKYQAFFGSSIDRLLQIKNKVDPTGLLYCGNCVGSDDWTVTDGKVCAK